MGFLGVGEIDFFVLSGRTQIGWSWVFVCEEGNKQQYIKYCTLGVFESSYEIKHTSCGFEAIETLLVVCWWGRIQQ